MQRLQYQLLMHSKRHLWAGQDGVGWGSGWDEGTTRASGMGPLATGKEAVALFREWARTVVMGMG
jgi:hypothetical protein